MKIIDTHTHLPGRSFGATPQSGEELQREFRSGGLSGAWIMTTDGLVGDTNANNDILARAVRDHLDFFVPFCTVNPHHGAEAAVAELTRCREELGMRGLKLHPWLQAFSMTHPAVLPIIERAGELGMPVLLHDGTPPYSTPLQIAAVAERAPRSTIILGHAGLHYLYRDAMAACLRHPNIHLCCCALPSGLLGEVLAACPTERILFGSDGGFARFVVREAIDRFLATGADEATLGRIFYENPNRMLPL